MSGGGEFVVSVAREGYFLVVGTGRLTIEGARRIRAEIDRVAALHPRIDRVLYDGSNVESFEHGQLIEWIQWRRTRPARAVAFVTRIQSAIAAGATMRFMLPRHRFAVFVTREPAIAFLLSENDAEQRRTLPR